MKILTVFHGAMLPGNGRGTYCAIGGLSEPSAAIFYNDQQPDQIFYKGLAMHKLGHTSEALDVFERLNRYGLANKEEDVKMDYFAVSLPDVCS